MKYGTKDAAPRIILGNALAEEQEHDVNGS